MRPAEKYQTALIFFGLAAAAMFAVFLYWELFPEYKIYQKDFIELERFRSSITSEPAAPFQYGVKQIVINREDKGPPVIDRCISCHVALQIEDFSPTKIARDLNGKIILDIAGNPVKEANENYIWKKLDDKIADLRDPKILDDLRKQGKDSTIKQRLQEAAHYESLKTANVGEQIFDVTKVLAMHPLIGKETRPFEFHPPEEYGCVSCHSGNGRALTTDKAHGPIFDDQYEITYMGEKPHFLEIDPKNDPRFSRMFNEKPGDKLLFQTTPILLDTLIQAKCVQCHQNSSAAVDSALFSTTRVAKRQTARSLAIQKSYENERDLLVSLIELKRQIENTSYDQAIKELNVRSADYTLPANEVDKAASQLKYIEKYTTKESALRHLSEAINKILGSQEFSQKLESEIASKNEKSVSEIVDSFISNQIKNSSPQGPIFEKAAAWNIEKETMKHVEETEESLQQAVDDPKFLNSIQTDIDILTKDFTKGKQLFISQACYACHRISGFSRGGIGPELTKASESYPWYLKESIVWPQADLPTSTMPNFHLDHDEVERLMTFLLSQTGRNQAISEATYKIALQEWEAGKKSPWEKPITPEQMVDLRYAMTVFATEGCSACHRLKGFESNVGFVVEQEKDLSFDRLYDEHRWFANLFPEDIQGSSIVAVIDENYQEIDQRIVDNVRQNSILEEIEKKAPGHIEALYSNFKFVDRAKNFEFEEKIKAEQDPEKRKELEKEQIRWHDRVHRILMTYIQEYGLGRLIGPRPNWSGIFRSDQWLMEHFHNPTGHVPRSIMPVFPFDDTKFYALTHMLDTLAIRNRNADHAIWENHGFDPALAAHIYCSQCHGEFLLGNGAVSVWIYPIPKNLRNPDFLRNMTKENIINSITHGMPGTPMPPWGEIAQDKTIEGNRPVLTKPQIQAIADWLFSSVPGGEVIRSGQDVPKWQYNPKNVIEELRREGNILEEKEEGEKLELSALSASLDLIAASNPDSSSEIFDVMPNQRGPEENAYYIKQKYYTDANIERGRQFFDLNCSVCHGSEADGSGIRSTMMSDAKPRMLTNLDWINAHDDLYLLRSIKYGVPGTAMTAWGDLTSGLQRLQLVMFIRSLSLSQTQRETLLASLYKAFEAQQLLIEKSRINAYEQLSHQQNEYSKLQQQLKEVAEKVKVGKMSADDATKAYQQSLDILKKIKQFEEIDQKYLELKQQIVLEQAIYKQLGLDILSQGTNESILKSLLSLINMYSNRYTIVNEKLVLNAAQINPQIEELSAKVLETIDNHMEILEQQKKAAEGRFTSNEKTEEISKINTELANLQKLRREMTGNFAEAARLNKKQNQIYQELIERQNG